MPVSIDVVVSEPPRVAKKSGKNGAAVVTAPAIATTPAAPTQKLKIPHNQLLIFTEQLGHLLNAGMTLDEGLSVLEKRLKQPRVQQMTHALHQALVDGRSFSQALRDFPRVFPPIYENLVAAGEASGALPDILARLVEHLTQAKNLRDSVQQALIHPAFLALAGVALITLFITFMVPQLVGFMSQNGGALPLPRRIRLGVDQVLANYCMLALAGGVGAIITFRAFVRIQLGLYRWAQ